MCMYKHEAETKKKIEEKKKRNSIIPKKNNFIFRITNLILGM